MEHVHHEDTPGIFLDFLKVDSFEGFFEIESDKTAPLGNFNVKGKLRAHVEFWEVIHAPPFIIDCIREGYKIPFYTTPLNASFKNNDDVRLLSIRGFL